MDRGYFYGQTTNFSFPLNTIDVLICHSLGLHFIPEDVLIGTRLLVLFGCFKYFHSEEKKESKLSKKIVNAMIKGLKTNPYNLLKEFYTNAYFPDEFENHLNSNVNHLKLMDDLIFLNNNKFNIEPLKVIPKILIFHGKEDIIVNQSKSIELHESLNNSNLVIFEKGGHALPFTHVSECWDIIRFEKE
ncbi:MAG: alpha/beta hydrolase [Desulfobacterales bacterium]|nr:alpha/beta hydrolase [Desulfobacterales bacterium]